MIHILDYGGGNLFSVARAAESLGYRVSIIHSPEQFTGGKLIVPGVGAFGDAMQGMFKAGLVDFLREKTGEGVPILGICLGMQILFESSEESPSVQGLQLLPGKVGRFHGAGKVPHMGWNQIYFENTDFLLRGIRPGEFVYFAHSYFVPVQHYPWEAATCRYLQDFVAVVHKDNLFGVQFHPEKSHKAGMQILKNFLEL